jgi:hypothetical protein
MTQTTQLRFVIAPSTRTSDRAYLWPVPLEIKKLDDESWIIAIKDHNYNVVHSTDKVFVVYPTKEAAVDAAKHITDLRKVKYA